MTSRLAAILLTLALAVAASACTSSGASAPTGGASAGAMSVSGAWARTSPTVALAGAAYLTLTNGTGQADALVGVTTAAAKNPEIHETTAEGSGMMVMRPVKRVELPAGGTVELKPGGYHIMLINLTGELKAGSTVELTLQFEKAAPVKVTAEVRAS